MADAVKRIGIQFILENIKDVSKTLKEIGQDNKVQLSVEFKDKKTIKNAMSKLNEELSSNFAEGINIGSLLGDALATGNLREAVNNVNALKEALSLLNKQIGVSGDAFKSKIASLNNQQVAELLQASSAIDKNSEIKNKQEAIQNKIDAFSVKGNLELTQKIEQSLDKISNNIEAIRRVTDDIGEGKIGRVLNEQAEGFDKVKKSAEDASEAFEEYNNKQIEFNQSGGTEKGKKGKAKNSTNNTQPVTPAKVPAGRDTSSQLDEEEGQVNRIQIVLEKYNNALNLSRVKKDNTLIQKFDSENKAITENIKLLQEEGYTLEVISKIYPKLIRGYTLWQEAQKNKEGKTSSATSTSINESKTETKLLSGLGKRDAVDKTKDEVDNMQQNLRRATNLEEYTQRYNESSIKIEQLKKELIELGIETEKVNNIFKEIKTPQVWEESRKQAEAYRLEQERIKKEEAEKNKSEDSKPKIKARIKRRILPLPSEIEKKSSIQNEQSDINQKAIDKITERANIIKNKLETKTENYDPIVQKKYAERYEEEKESIEQLKKELEELGTESSKIEEILSRIRKPDEWNKIAREVREARKNSLVDQTEIDAIGDKFIGDSVQRTVGMSTEAQRHVEDDFSNETAKTIKSEEGIVSNLEIENEELNEVINRLVESNNTLSQMVIGNINFNATNLASEYKNATQTIQNNMDEYYRLIEETEQEVDFEKLGLTNIDEDGNILDSAKNKIIENVKQKITNINGELGQIKDPTEFQKKYESLQSLITNIKGLLSSLEVKDIDGLFGSDNFNLEKALEIRKKALEQIEKEKEKISRTNPTQIQKKSNIIMMDDSVPTQAYSTDNPVGEQQELTDAVNKTTEALKEQAEISSQVNQIVADNTKSKTQTEEEIKFGVGTTNYIPVITEQMNEANKDLAEEVNKILKIYAESRGIIAKNDKAKEYVSQYLNNQDIIAGYKEDFKNMTYTLDSGKTLKGSTVLNTKSASHIKAFSVVKILDFYKELTNAMGVINSQESSEEDISQAKIQAENIKKKILGLVDIYTSYGGKDLVNRLTTELGKDTSIDAGSLEQITTAFQSFINEIIDEKNKIRNLGEEAKNAIVAEQDLGNKKDIGMTRAYSGEIFNLSSALERQYKVKFSDDDREKISSLFPQAKSTTRFFGEDNVEAEKIFEEIKKILIAKIQQTLKSQKTDTEKQRYKEYIQALKQEGDASIRDIIAQTEAEKGGSSQPAFTSPEAKSSAIETSKAVTGEGSAAETASVQFNDLTEAKKAFALANQEARGSAEATAEAILKEGQASETASATMEGAVKKGQEILEKLKQNNTNVKILSPKDVLDNTSSIASTITEVKRKTNSTRGISKTYFVRNNNEDVPEAKIAKSTEMAEDTLQKSLALLATNPIDFSTLLNETEEKLNTINQLKDIVKVFQGKETKVEGLKGLGEEDLVDKIREEMNVFLDNRKAIDTALIDLEKGEEVDLQAKIIEYRKSQIRVQKMMQQLINKNGGKTDAEGNKRTYLQTTEDIIGKYWGNETSLFEGYLKDFEGIYNPATDKFRSAEEIGLQIFKYNKEDFNNLQEYYENLKKIIDYITEHQSEIIAKAVELNKTFQGNSLKKEDSSTQPSGQTKKTAEKTLNNQLIQISQDKTSSTSSTTPIITQAHSQLQASEIVEQSRESVEQASVVAEKAEQTAEHTLAIWDKINEIRNTIASGRDLNSQLTFADIADEEGRINRIGNTIKNLKSTPTLQDTIKSGINIDTITEEMVRNSREEVERELNAQLSNEDLLGFFKTALKRRQNTVPNIESNINSFIEDFNNAKIEGVSKKSSNELIKQIDDSLRVMGELYDNNQQKSQDFVFEQLKIVQSIRQLYKKGYSKDNLYVNNDKEATQKILGNLYEEGKIGADISTVSLMSRYFDNVGNSKTGNFATYNDMINKQVGQDMQNLQNIMEEISSLTTIIDYIENHLASLSTARRFLESGNTIELPTDNLQKYQEEQRKKEEQKRREEYNNIASRMDEEEKQQRIDAKNSLERFSKQQEHGTGQVPIINPEQTQTITETANAVEKVNEAVEHASEQADKPILNLEDEKQEVEQLTQAVNNFADSLGIIHGNAVNTNVSGTVGTSITGGSMAISDNTANLENGLNILTPLSSLSSTLDEASAKVVNELSQKLALLGQQINNIQTQVLNFKFNEESLVTLKEFKETLEAISNSVVTIVGKWKNLPSITRQVNQANNIQEGQKEDKATKSQLNTDDTIKEELKKDLKTLTGRGATSLFARETLREKRRNLAEEGQELFNPKDITNLEKADALYEKVTRRISELKEHGKTEILNDPEIKALLEERETQIRNAYIGKINKNVNQGKIGVEEKIQTEQDAELAKIKEIESAYNRLKELASPLAVNEEYLTTGQATNAMAKAYNQQSKEFLNLQNIINSEETQKLVEAGKISPEVISSYEEAIAKAKERQEEIRKEIQLLQEKAQLESETKEYNSQVQQVESVYKELMGIVGNGRDFNIFQKASELENGTDTSQATAKKINRYGQLTAYLESVRDADAERIAQGQTPIMAGVSEEVIKNYQTALEFAEKLYEKTVATEEAMKRQAERQEQYNALIARMDKVEGEEKQDSKDSWGRYKQQEKIQKEREAEREKLRKQEETENKARIAEERRREEQAFNEDTKTATNFYKQLISSEEEYLKLLQQEREGKLNPKENGELTDAQKKNRLKLAEYRKMRETDENGEYLALSAIQGKDWQRVSDVNNLRKEYQTKKENLHQAGYMTDEEAEIVKVNAAYQVLIKTQEQYLRLRTKEKDGQTLTKKEANDLQKLAEERKKAWGAINETKKNNPSAFENETIKTKQSQYAESKTQAKQVVDNSKAIEEISSLYDKMYKARNELNKLVNDSMVGKGDSDAIKKKLQEIDEYTKKIHEATEALKENETLYQQAQDIKLHYEEGENDEFKRQNNVNTPSSKLTSNLQNTFTNLTGLYQEYSGSEYIHQGEYLNTLEQQAERIAEILVDIKNNPIDITKKEDLKRLQEYNEELTQMDAKIKKDKKEASGFKQANGTKLARNITDFLSKNHGISEEASTTLREQLTRLDNGVNIKELKEVGQIYEDIKRQEIEAGRTGMTFFDTLKQRAQGLTATLATYVSFWRIISTVKQGFNTFKQFDSALAEMQKVSNETISTLKEFQQASFDLADSIGTDALSLQQSVAEFMRLGQSLEEATDSAQAANVLFNVSEFESAKDASTALIAMSQAYDELSNTQIIDVINKLGNDFPISTEGLATALQDGAASLTTAGNDFYEAAALVTAGNRITQDPSKVGKAMRTIALRLTGTEASAEELEADGEEVEGMIKNVSKLRDVIMQATKVDSNNNKGIDILNDVGAYKSTYDILLEIAEIYDEIVEKDKQYGTKQANLLLETIAGRFCLKNMETYFYRTHLTALVA